MPDAAGVGNAVFKAGTIGLLFYQERLDVTILNPVLNPPSQNVQKMDENGIWNAIYIPASNSIRCSMV